MHYHKVSTQTQRITAEMIRRLRLDPNDKEAIAWLKGQGISYLKLGKFEKRLR